MNLERYEYEKNATRHEYEFYSIGPKGPILKVVRFDLKVTDGVPYFYLSFGDWDEKEKWLNDTIVSNNGDAEKVLGTVANIILSFTEQFPDSLVYAEGSTMARTRRYQMGISKLWNEIYTVFDVYGLTADNRWKAFEKNVNYEAFLIRRKKCNFK
ncbi:MAG TPA: hypothetical protein VNS58_15180 [Puia sp.]|nr:hypothetical protein [Puia sp.]